jgi:hypothetical protein
MELSPNKQYKNIGKGEAQTIATACVTSPRKNPVLDAENFYSPARDPDHSYNLVYERRIEANAKYASRKKANSLSARAKKHPMGRNTSAPMGSGNSYIKQQLNQNLRKLDLQYLDENFKNYPREDLEGMFQEFLAKNSKDYATANPVKCGSFNSDHRPTSKPKQRSRLGSDEIPWVNNSSHRNLFQKVRQEIDPNPP